jgi:hypothetical protein
MMELFLIIFILNEKYWKEYDDKIELLNENFEVTSRFKKK